MTSFSDVQLQTSRLLLRPVHQGDAADVFALRSNDDVMRYTGNLPWTSIESAQAWIDQDIKWLANGESLRLGLVRREEGDMIGTCTLFELNQQCRRAEIGYDLRPDFWGRGYINEALTALLQFGFTTMQLNRVEADVDPLNAASIRALERLGFQREGFMRERWIVNGIKADTAFFGLLLSDWEAGMQSGAIKLP